MNIHEVYDIYDYMEIPQKFDKINYFGDNQAEFCNYPFCYDRCHIIWIIIGDIIIVQN
jgi:hypothetical protein